MSIHITINGHPFTFDKEMTILEACRQVKIYLPVLCFHEDLPSSGKCGLCISKVDGTNYVHSCLTKIRDGMEVETNSLDVTTKARKAFDSFLDMSQPPPSKDIEEISKYLFPKHAYRARTYDQTDSIIFSPELCVNCSRCIRMCNDVQSIAALNEPNPRMRYNECISCGQCLTVCPTGALHETPGISLFLRALGSGKTLVLQTAPAVRVAVGELFGLPIGTVVTGKIITAARMMGVKYVLDTNFGADLTVIEEGHELLNRIVNKSTSSLPQFTSCCPAWINFVEKHHPELIPNLSSCKSPHMMVGKLVKTYFAQRLKIHPNSLCVISLMPCVAKKTEIRRMQLNNDVDVVLTTREFGKLVETFGYDFTSLRDGQFDDLMSEGTGASVIFGVTGGVAEAAVRYCVEQLLSKNPPNMSDVTELPYQSKKLSKVLKPTSISSIYTSKNDRTVRHVQSNIFNTSQKPVIFSPVQNSVINGTNASWQLGRQYQQIVNPLSESKQISTTKSIDVFNEGSVFAEGARLEYMELRGFKSIKIAKIKVEDLTVNVAVCNGISAAKELIESGKYKQFHFVEVMACPGGCVVGGGQPKLKNKKLAEARSNSIYALDIDSRDRVSSKNYQLRKLYSTFLGKPGSEVAEDLLHTHYEPQETSLLLKRKRMEDMPIVAYGSSSGTSMKWARTVAKFMGTNSVSMNNISINQMLKRKIAIFVISTIGDGEYPANSRKFIHELKESMENLMDVKVAILGLGSHEFKQFCAAGKNLSEILEQHLARAIVPFTAIDTSIGDKGEGAFEKWCFKLCSALQLDPPKIGIRLLYTLEKEDDISIIHQPLRPLTFEKGIITSRKRITPEDYCREIYIYSIKLPQGYTYETGDLVEIFAQNDEETVQAVLKALDIEPNDVYRLISNGGTNEGYIPQKISSYQLFKQYLDLHGPPNRSIMRAFLQVANEEGAVRLNQLLDVSHEEILHNYLEDITTAEFILEFAQYGKPSIGLLLSSCPIIIPRCYTIATSSEMIKDRLDIVVSTRFFGGGKKSNGEERKLRKGLCSSFLTTPNLTNISLRIIEGTNKPPSSPEAPMIMVALGAGIGSILGLLQYRVHLLNDEEITLGPAILFYGIQNEAAYAPIIERIKKFEKKGVLTTTHYAFSRDDPEKRIHVQDLMKANKRELFQYWQNSSCELFYCGLAGSVPDELKSILLSSIIEIGGMAMEEALAVNDRHKFNIEAFS